MPTKVIAIANQKGGVGKTTITATLGHGLALKGKRVLLIDLDSQGSLAVLLNLPTNSGTFDWLTTEPDDRAKVKFIYSRIVGSETRPNLWLLPGNKQTNIAENNIRQMAFNAAYSPYGGGKKPMEHITYIYERMAIFKDLGMDYIVIDTPPGIGGLQEGAIYASDMFIVPTVPAHLAGRGVKSLLDDVNAMNQRMDGAGKDAGAFLGVLLNQYEENTIATRDTMDLISKAFDAHVLPPIHRAQVFLQCETEGVTIFEKDPRSRAAKEYIDLVDVLMRARVKVNR